MKQDPITFRFACREGNGFIPFRNEKGEWIHQRDIVLEPFDWKNGFGVRISIVEHFSDVNGILAPYQRLIARSDFYDRDNLQLLELISALASGDLRGQYAAGIAHRLYWELFSTSKELEEFLPELFKFNAEFKYKHSKVI